MANGCIFAYCLASSSTGTKSKKSYRSAPLVPQTDLFHRRQKGRSFPREYEKHGRRSTGGSTLSKLRPEWSRSPAGSKLELEPPFESSKTTHKGVGFNSAGSRQSSLIAVSSRCSNSETDHDLWFQVQDNSKLGQSPVSGGQEQLQRGLHMESTWATTTTNPNAENILHFFQNLARFVDIRFSHLVSI